MSRDLLAAARGPQMTADDLLPPPGRAADDGEARENRSGVRRALAGLLVLLAVLVGGLVGAVVFVDHRIAQGIEWLGDPFAVLPTRPPESVAATGAAAPLNILVVGSDSRFSAGDPSQWEYGAQRTDAIMLLHVPGDRSGVFGISIPRDSWVDVPGYGEAKINAAFSYGGPPLLIHTVENLTGVYIDHLAVTDFESFAELTDAVGGVTVTIPETTYDRRRGVTVPAGTYEMDGAAALDYVRQRYGLPEGDLDRVQRQQNWMRQIARSTLESDVLANPFALTRVLVTAGESLAVDDAFTTARMRDLAISLRNVRGDDLHFVTVPVEGLGRSPDGAQSIVVLDRDGVAELSQAVANDQVAAYLAQSPGNVDILGDRVD
jgi:LCP family protein required for cell wall assembly